MIKANKQAWFQAMFHLYNQQLLKRYFKGIYVSSSLPLPTRAIVCLNHSSWWDSLVLFHLNRTYLKTDLYVMMHEKGIRQYPFFRKLGAFSVNRDHPKDIIYSLKYSEILLDQGKTVGLFPQGDEYHLEKRPLTFLPGAIALQDKRPSVPILPISLYYSFGHSKKQEIYIVIGEPINSLSFTGKTRKERNRELEDTFTSQLNLLKNKVVHEQTSCFRQIL